MATALITGTVGCGNTEGGSTIEKDSGNGGSGTTTDWTELTLADLAGDYMGQQFIETNANGGNHEYITQRFDSAFADAQKYLNQKVANLQKDLHDKVTSAQIANNDFYKTLDTALKKSTNNQAYIGSNVQNNYENNAQYFAIMDKVLTDDNNNAPLWLFRVSYYQLAHKAYNRSLGGGANTNYGDDFPSNKGDMDEGSAFLTPKLARANISYQELTTNANQYMDQSLALIATKTSTDQDLLKKAVELALYNESLYGLHDMAIESGVDKAQIDSIPKRKTLSFNNRIQAVINQQAKSIDDRTM